MQASHNSRNTIPPRRKYVDYIAALDASRRHPRQGPSTRGRLSHSATASERQQPPPLCRPVPRERKGALRDPTDRRCQPAPPASATAASTQHHANNERFGARQQWRKLHGSLQACSSGRAQACARTCAKPCLSCLLGMGFDLLFFSCAFGAFRLYGPLKKVADFFKYLSAYLAFLKISFFLTSALFYLHICSLCG